MGLWIVVAQATEAVCQIPPMLAQIPMVVIYKEEDKYKIEINGPIEFSINAESLIDRDILIAFLNECRTPEGKKVIVQQALAEALGLKDRREIDNRMQRYRKSGNSMKGIVRPYFTRASVLTQEVKEAIVKFWSKNWFAKEREVFDHLKAIGLFKSDAKFNATTIKNAVSEEFLKLRAHLKKSFEQGLISYKKDELVAQLFELIESQSKILKENNLLPKVEEIEIESLKTFSSTNSLKKELKETLRIKNIKEHLMNPLHQSQDLLLSKPLQAIKYYMYFSSSYGRVAQFLKVSKSSVFYWVHSFSLFLKVTYLFPPQCSGTVGFDAKWVKIKKTHSKGKQKKGTEWGFVYIAIDCHTLDLLHSQIFLHEDYNCTKLFLLQLKNKGFSPKAIITDMHVAYPKAIKEVFPKAQHAICIFHLLQAAQRNIKEVFGKGYMKNKEVVALKKEIYKLFDAKDKRTVIKRMESFMAKRNHFVSLNPKAGKIFDSIERHFSQALLSIGNPTIPHTNNAVERVNRRFNQHYKNMACFESMRTARAYLTLFAFFYRITPFYEAKDKRIKGMAPIQIAGIDIENIPAVKAFGII
jgi:transposase-like protein